MSGLPVFFICSWRTENSINQKINKQINPTDISLINIMSKIDCERSKIKSILTYILHKL